ISPTGRHPLAAWQMRTPVGPHGAQERLQHAPPHWGMPPSVTTWPSEQTMPSTRLHCAPPDGGWLHPPKIAPGALLQMPPQQSLGWVQMSPTWPQNDEAPQKPARQLFEQHCEPSVHLLPRVRQLALSDVHVLPAPHVPLQQSPFTAQASPSEVQRGG